MFTLIRTLPLRLLLREQLPVLVVSWLIAEMFYKFHSFSLECAAFLLTWFLFDCLVQFFKRVLGRLPSSDMLR